MQSHLGTAQTQAHLGTAQTQAHLGTAQTRAQGGTAQTGAVPGSVLAPAAGDDWLALTDQQLPVAALYDWAIMPRCGAVVVFSGTVRDHAEGRDGVEQLVYEAYERAAVDRFAAIAAEARGRWPSIGRVAIVHRIGPLAVTDSAVVVAVSAPHRGDAFEAARFVIDTVKETVPIWKHETWRDGADWGTGATPIRNVQRVGGS